MYVALKMWTKWGGRELRGEGGRDGGREGLGTQSVSRIVMGRTSISLGNDLLQSGCVDDGATLVVLGSWDLSPPALLLAVRIFRSGRGRHLFLERVGRCSRSEVAFI